MPRLKGVAKPPKYCQESTAPPARLLRLPRRSYIRNWRQTRADGTAFEKTGIGWIVCSTAALCAGRPWTFMPFDPTVKHSRHKSKDDAMRAADEYEDSIAKAS